MEPVKVIEIRPTRKPGPLRAFVDVRLGHLLVTDFRVFQADRGPARIEVPMVTWRDPDTHQIRFKPVVTLPGELFGRVQAEILFAYYRMMEENKNDRKNQ